MNADTSEFESESQKEETRKTNHASHKDYKHFPTWRG